MATLPLGADETIAAPRVAVRRFGILRGLVLAAWRLLRCNPFSYGGYDPVEAQRVFRGARRRAP